MIKCLYQRVRHNKWEIYYYCTKNRKNVPITCYIGCLDKEYKKVKPLKQKSDKQKQIESKRFSILQQNKSKCYFCDKRAVDTHELIKGRNRKKCIKWGLVVYLCRDCHRKTEEDGKFYQETRKLAQKVWQEHYNKTKKDFLKEFGRSYL